MADIVAGSDASHAKSLIAYSNAADGTFVQLWADPVTHRLLVDNVGSSNSLSVTDGVTTVTGVTVLDFTSGATVTNAGGGEANVAISASGGGITIGTTTITSGTTTRVLYDNAGVVGEYTISGTGNVAMTTSPVFTTPNIGAATATTINGVTIPSVTDTVALLGATQTFTGVNTFTPTARASGVASYFTVTTPADTAITASTEAIGINKPTATRTWATTGTVALQREVYLAGVTYASASASQTFTDITTLYVDRPLVGTNAIFTRAHSVVIVDSTSAASSITGGFVIATTLGTAATSVGIGAGNINAGGTLTVGGASSLHTTTIAGATATTALTLTQTARTSGVLPYIKWTIPTDTAQTASTESPGLQVVTGTRTWATTGTVALQRENYFAGPTYASASASQTFTDAFTFYIDAPIAGSNAIFTRAHSLGIVDATSAASSVTGGLVISTTLGTTATSVGIGGGNINAGGTITAGGHVTFEGVTSTGATGTNLLVFATSPTLSNPTVGTQATTDNSTLAASTAYVTTAVNNAIAGVNPAVAVQAATTAASDTSGFTYSNGASGIGATFTGTTNTAITIDGFTFTALGQRLLVKNDTQSPSGAFNGVYYVTQVQTGILPPILTRALDYDQPSDMNNTGAIPVVNGTANANTSWLLTSTVVTVGTTPLTYVQFSLAPSSIVTLTGSQALTNKTYNGVTITSASATLTLPSLATITFGQGMTLTAGAGAQTFTFPSTSATVARTDAAQTFTGTQTFAQIVTTSNAITATSNAATVPITSRISTVTNNSAATLTITITTTSAVDGQMIMVRILDFSAVAQTITWVNTENSTVSAPTTSNGSTTLPLTVGLQFNSQTTKWRVIAAA